MDDLDLATFYRLGYMFAIKVIKPSFLVFDFTYLWGTPLVGNK
jgi:hypothetical protein